ncbi:hypothetical protein ANCCAN_28699, partial [Ancylostoma caninum]
LGVFQVATYLYHPGQHPNGLIGPARFQWSREDQTFYLALWIHPSCRDEVFNVVKELLELVKEADMEEGEPVSFPRTVEEWRLSKMRVHTDTWIGKSGVKVQDLRDQLVRFRLYGPLALAIVSDALKLVDDEKAAEFRENHAEWRESISTLPPGNAVDGSLFSLLVEDPRISRPSVKQVPCPESSDPSSDTRATIQAHFWSKDVRMKALADRLTDSDLNKLKGKSLGQIKETAAKV